MNFFEIKKYFVQKLTNFYNSREIDAFLKLILEDLWNIKSIDLISKDLIFDNIKITSIDKIIEQLQQYKPIQYILGKTFFYNCFIEVNENVLIPRPETEELTEKILKENNIENASFLDICTGSGCIAVSVAKEKKWMVYATDISAKAIETAKNNAISNNLNIFFSEIDFLNKKEWRIYENLKFDIIVSNPPYVQNNEKQQMEQNVLNYEPHLALFVEDDAPLIFYNAIASFAIEHLTNNGVVYVEINEKLGKQTADVFKLNGFKNLEILKDFRNKDRFIKVKK